MPYLMNPTELATAIGAQCGGSSVSADNTVLLGMLSLLLPRVEDLMEVASLTYGETTDTFKFSDNSYDPVVWDCSRLRLSNGYVENSEEHPVTILDPNGEPVTDFTIDERYGVVTLPNWIKGYYTIAYYAGFKTAEHPDDWEDGDPEFFDSPQWVKGVTTELLVMVYRTSQKQLQLPLNIRYHELVEQLDKEIKRRVYQRYQRPRDVEFPVRSVRTDGMLT